MDSQNTGLTPVKSELEQLSLSTPAKSQEIKENTQDLSGNNSADLEKPQIKSTPLDTIHEKEEPSSEESMNRIINSLTLYRR